MKRKKLAALIIIGAMLFSGSSAIAAQTVNTDTLDIEKTAVQEINNSQSVKTFNEQKDDAQKQYDSAKISAQNGLLHGGGSAAAVIREITAPMEAQNTLNQFITNQEVTTNTVKLSAYSQYIALLKANYNANVQKQLMDNLEQDYKKAQLQLNNGLISKNDTRLIEINYLKAVYKFNSFQKSLDSAYMAVNLATGVDISMRYKTLIDNNIIPASQIRSLDEYIKGALANRGEIVNAQNTLDTKKKEFEYEKAFYRTDYDFYIEQTQYDIDSSQNSLDEAKVTIQLEITNGYKDLQSKMKAVESQQANYNLADANYKAAQVKYNNSMITLKEFEDAEAAKTQAQINLKNAQLDAWLAQIKMDNACDLGPGLN